MAELLIGWLFKPEYGWTFTDKVVIIIELGIFISICIITEILVLRRKMKCKK